jgi:hypothetical protein
MNNLQVSFIILFKSHQLMKKTFTLLSALLFALISFSQFTPGNVVILRVGDGLDSLKNSGSPVFLAEYTPAGVLVQAVPLPTEISGANKRLILNGLSTSEGMLQRSPNGLYLTVPGYDTAMGGPRPLNNTLASTTNRSIARIAYNEAIDLTTALSDYSSNGNPRSAVTTDGTKFWALGGAGGIRFATLGATTSIQLSTAPTNLRTVNIANDQLYISTASGSAVRIGTVGTGLPEVSGNTITNLPGFPTTTGPYQFAFFDLSAAVPGPDVLYVANDDANVIQKFSLVGGTWTLNGTAGTDMDYRGITGEYLVGASGVILYLTRRGGSTKGGGGEFASLTDAGGYNAAFSGEPTLLAEAADSMAFRGIALVPLQNPLPLSLLSFTASKTAAGTLLVWTTNKEFNVSHFELQKGTDGAQFKSLGKTVAKGNELYNEYRTVDKEILSGAVYYRLKMVDKDGKVKYSHVVKVSGNGKNKFAVRPNPAAGSITVEHPLVKGAASIRILMNDGRQVNAYNVPDGSYQTSLNISQLTPGSYRLVFENENVKLSSLLMKQ